MLDCTFTAEQRLLLEPLCLRDFGTLGLESLRFLLLLHTLGLQGLAADERPYCRLHLAGHAVSRTATLAVVKVIGGCKIRITAKILIGICILASLTQP